MLVRNYQAKAYVYNATAQARRQRFCNTVTTLLVACLVAYATYAYSNCVQLVPRMDSIQGFSEADIYLTNRTFNIPITLHSLSTKISGNIAFSLQTQDDRLVTYLVQVRPREVGGVNTVDALAPQVVNVQNGFGFNVIVQPIAGQMRPNLASLTCRVIYAFCAAFIVQKYIYWHFLTYVSDYDPRSRRYFI